MTAPVRVFLVDDHEVVRQGVRAHLAASSVVEVVGEAASAAAALVMLGTMEVGFPDVILLDCHLPDGTGIEVCRTVRSRHPEVRVLFLTSLADEETVMAAVLAGAAGYLLKDVRLEGLTDAILQVAAGESLIEPGIYERLARRAEAAAQNTLGVARLTRQERRILLLLSEGLTDAQIAVRVGLAERTVAAYVGSILAKLGLYRRAHATVYASQVAAAPLPEPTQRRAVSRRGRGPTG